MSAKFANEIVVIDPTGTFATGGTRITYSAGTLSFGTAASGAGAARTIQGQAAASGSAASGGDLQLQPGLGDGVGVGGALCLFTATGSLTLKADQYANIGIYRSSGTELAYRFSPTDNAIDFRSESYLIWSDGSSPAGSRNTQIGRAAPGVLDFSKNGGGGATLRSAPLAVSLNANQDNFNIGVARYYEVTPDAAGRSISGIAINQMDGQECWLRNASLTGDRYFVLANQSASSTAANRFANGFGTSSYSDMRIYPGNVVKLRYDAMMSRWVASPETPGGLLVQERQAGVVLSGAGTGGLLVDGNGSNGSYCFALAYSGNYGVVYPAGNTQLGLGTSINLVWGDGLTVSPTVGIIRAANKVIEINNATIGGAGGTIRSVPLAVSFSANQNDYAIGVARTIILNNTSGASKDITSINIGQVDGQEFSIILNAASAAVVLRNASASGTAANRFLTDTGADITLAVGTRKRADFIYNATASRWEVR